MNLSKTILIFFILFGGLMFDSRHKETTFKLLFNNLGMAGIGTALIIAIDSNFEI